MDSVDYYERYASVYFENTVNISMEGPLKRFLELMPENAEVLDLGCGSGRDSIYMEEEGCYVTLLDGSEQMCKLAEIHTDKEVLHMTFSEMDFQEVFDGIWACASLLHVEEKEIDSIMEKVTAALKPGGVLYMSFQHGDAEEFRNHRLFHDYNRETLEELIASRPEFKLIDMWISDDVRENHKEWINVLVRKRPSKENIQNEEDYE